MKRNKIPADPKVMRLIWNDPVELKIKTSIQKYIRTMSLSSKACEELHKRFILAFGETVAYQIMDEILRVGVVA